MSFLHVHAVKAECKRQLNSMLGNPLGYIFILVFVLVVAACLFVPAEFYARNIADLWWLKDIMPWILAVVLPAFYVWVVGRRSANWEPRISCSRCPCASAMC